eukprot:m.191982 g.191982  ORF g.191982 m.191982 type:complete len:74 (+) comp18604_c0_seq1:146-367(+)
MRTRALQSQNSIGTRLKSNEIQFDGIVCGPVHGRCSGYRCLWATLTRRWRILLSKTVAFEEKLCRVFAVSTVT